MIWKSIKRIRELPSREALRGLAALPAYFFHRIRKDGMSSRPLLITVELTYRCDLACPYCYLGERGKSDDSLATGSIESLLDSLGAYKPIFHLTGGEPFLRDDLNSIITRIHAHGCYCTVSTNGSLISEGRASWLREIRPDYFMISLNGLEGEHDEFCSCRGDFQRTMSGIRYLGELGLMDRVSVNTVLNPLNIDRIPDFMRLVKRSGINRVSFQHKMLPASISVPAREKMSLKSSAFGLIDPHRMNKTIGEIKLNARILGMRVRFIPELSPAEVVQWHSKGFTRQCRYPFFASRIDPEGNVYACQNLRRVFGNIHSESLLDIWNGEEFRKFRNRLRRGSFYPECSNCCKI